MSGWQHATPLRAHALAKAVAEDARFRLLSAKSQAALLVSVVRHADHNGRWYFKAETLAAELGRSARRTGDALAEACESTPPWLPLLIARRRRRPDGTLGVYDYELGAGVIAQADAFVVLWTNQRTKTSSGASHDKTVAWPSPDETVRAGTASNGYMNGSPAGDAADAVAGDHAQWWIDNIGVEYAHDPQAFAEEASAALRVDHATAEQFRIALLARDVSL